MSTIPTSTPSVPVAAVARSADGLAIASFVLSLLGFGLLGVVFGHVSLARTRRTGDAGAGFAIAGLVIGYLEIIAIAIVLLVVAGGVIFAVNQP